MKLPDDFINQEEIVLEIVDPRTQADKKSVPPYRGCLVRITDHNGNEVLLDLPDAEKFANRLFQFAASVSDEVEK